MTAILKHIKSRSATPKLITVSGARPNFIKIAPLCHEFQKVSNKIKNILLHTGQHYDFKMSGGFFDDLNIQKPDILLETGSLSHTAQTANIMLKFEDVCLKERPDCVIVVGDVNSTLACALVAKKLMIKLAHVEAGLRSFDMSMPEEINRKVTDCISDLLFTHSADADNNLIREGIDVSKIKNVGNIMIDTLVAEMDKINNKNTYKKWGLKPNKYVYVTLHRPSNVDIPDVLSVILDNLRKLSETWTIVFPIHPRTMYNIDNFGIRDKIIGAGRLIVTEPVSYHDSINLAKNAAFVLTDSGGLQEETTYLGVPCLTLRPNTERPITITHGTNKLTSIDNLWMDIEDILSKTSSRAAPKGSIIFTPPPLWDGQTASRIVDIMLNLIN